MLQNLKIKDDVSFISSGWTERIQNILNTCWCTTCSSESHHDAYHYHYVPLYPQLYTYSRSAMIVYIDARLTVHIHDLAYDYYVSGSKLRQIVASPRGLFGLSLGLGNTFVCVLSAVLPHETDARSSRRDMIQSGLRKYVVVCVCLEIGWHSELDAVQLCSMML